jgi:ABC-2 type transport system ATP-binding protein
MLQLTNVRKSFNRRPVLDIPFLQLANGIYWLKGANGSGKTTLLKMVAGLLPFEGDILFRSVSLRDQPLTYRQMISWAEAEPLFPAFMTGTELISLYRDIRKVDQKDVDRLLDIFSMTSYVDSTIGTYSAGMTKKLSLVLAFLGDPPLIVLDEPLITLDAESLTSVNAYIGEKCKNPGTLFLLSSHQDADMRLLPSGKELLVRNQAIFD